MPPFDPRAHLPLKSLSPFILFPRALRYFSENIPFINTDFMKNADRPFIGIIIVSIAVLYSVIALLA
jgi:hypothetical protein